MRTNLENAPVANSLAIPAATHDRGAFGFVLLVWGLMLIAGLGLVTAYGRNVPTWDDWDMVPAATGNQPITAEWLWSQHNEHRDPLPRLVLLGLLRGSPLDFRTGMYFNVLTTGVIALGLILTTRRLRGHSSYFDAFFPIAIMSWGQAVNFLWCWQVQYSVSVLLMSAVLMLVARAPRPPNLSTTVAVGFCAMLLPLCGATGLGLVPAFALWLGYVAFVQWRTASVRERRHALISAGFALVSMVLVALYFVGYSRSPYVPLTRNPRSIAVGAAQFLSMGFGPGVIGLSFDDRTPFFFWKVVCAAVVGLFVATGVMLSLAWWKQPDERVRTAGLGLALGAVISLALGLGMGRQAFEPRYLTLSVPGLCAIYLAWTIYSAPRVQRIASALLFATALLALGPNTMWGWRWAEYLKSHLVAFERDLKAGDPPYRLQQKHGDLHQDHEIMMDYMPMLRIAQVGAFRYLRDDPPFHEVALPLAPTEFQRMNWNNRTAQAYDKEAWLTWSLPSDVRIAGVRLDYTYSDPGGVEPFLGIYWKSSKQPDFAEERSIRYHPLGDRANWRNGTWSRRDKAVTTFHAWVDAPVQSVRVLAVEKATITIQRLVLLVPDQQDASAKKVASNE